MQNSYGNISVRGVERAKLVDWLKAKNADAWIGPAQGDWTAFSDPPTDAFDLAVACETMVALTADIGGTAIAAAVHNADVLGILAADRGRHVSSYISYPGIFEEGPPTEDRKPAISGASGLLAALGAPVDEAELIRLLAVGTTEQFVYPIDVHAGFVRACGLPEYTRSFGYAKAETGELPGDPLGFVRLGDARRVTRRD